MDEHTCQMCLQVMKWIDTLLKVSAGHEMDGHKHCQVSAGHEMDEDKLSKVSAGHEMAG